MSILVKQKPVLVLADGRQAIHWVHGTANCIGSLVVNIPLGINRQPLPSRFIKAFQSAALERFPVVVCI